MWILLFVLAQATSSPKIITDKNIAQVRSCHCKPTDAQLEGLRARQYVYVPPVPLLGPTVTISGGRYGDNLITKHRPFWLSYPYDFTRYAEQPYRRYEQHRPIIVQSRRRYDAQK